MDEKNKHSTTLMWFARIGGAIISIFWLISFFASSIGENIESQLNLTLEGIILLVLIVASTIGVGIAWKHPLTGGKVTVISSLFLCIFAYFSAGDNKMFAVAVSGLPYFLVGVLFIQSQLAKEEKP
jgi:hypothetical protein